MAKSTTYRFPCGCELAIGLYILSISSLTESLQYGEIMGSKVSVVMPCYNHVKYIASAIESVLGQTHKNIELVLIDNCSTDGTREIIQQFEKKDGRIIAIYHEKNLGFITSMNHGLDASSGDYIALTSSDDVWLPEKTEIQLRAFEDNPEVDVIHSDASIIDSAGKKTGKTMKKIYRLDPAIASGNIFKTLTRNNICCTSTVIFRKKCLKTCDKFDIDLHYAPDWWFLIELSRKHKFLYIDRILADYRVHATNLTRNINLVYSDFVTIHSRIAEMGIEPKHHTMIVAASAAIVGRNEEARAAVKKARGLDGLSLQESTMAFIIEHFSNSGQILLTLNKGKHLFLDSAYSLRH
jgi:glycosyltransferase involved in cell wall biosynthesis